VIWRKPLALAADAGLSMGFQSIFARKALPEAEFSKKAVIDGHRFSHIGLFGTRLIVTRERSFPKRGISRISDAAWIGHAAASAATAASSKSL